MNVLCVHMRVGTMWLCMHICLIHSTCVEGRRKHQSPLASDFKAGSLLCVLCCIC